MIRRTETIEVKPTVEELAEEFWELGSDEQAKFFNHLAEIAKTPKIELQLGAVAIEKELKTTGRKIMRLIGEYADENH